VVFALKLDYFKAFNLSEGRFSDHSGEHEGGETEVPSQKLRDMKRLLETVFYQSLIFPNVGPGGRGGMGAGSTRAI
jgi:hypothetical protein